LEWASAADDWLRRVSIVCLSLYIPSSTVSRFRVTLYLRVSRSLESLAFDCLSLALDCLSLARFLHTCTHMHTLMRTSLRLCKYTHSMSPLFCSRSTAPSPCLSLSVSLYCRTRTCTRKRAQRQTLNYTHTHTQIPRWPSRRHTQRRPAHPFCECQSLTRCTVALSEYIYMNMYI